MQLQAQIKNAIGAHAMWKARLQSAIDKNSSEFSPEAVRFDDKCEFGKWLRDISEPSIRDSASYRKCMDLHREFHQVAASTLDLALNGHKEDAAKSMAAGGNYGKVSASLTGAMIDWSRLAGK